MIVARGVRSRYWSPLMRAALLLVLFCACASPSPPPGAAGPVEAAKDFAAAIQRGDGAAAYALLSTRTQKEADEIAGRAREAAGDAGTGPASGRQMLLASARPQGKVEVHRISQESDTAVVEVADASGRSQRYRAVRENGVWRLDLDLAPDGG
jgi:Domain of unknown function (DUF4878)